MAFLMDGCKQWNSVITKAVIYTALFLFLTMSLFVSEDKSPTLVDPPVRIVPIRQISSSNGSSYVNDSSLRVNQTFSSEFQRVIENNQTDSNTKVETKDDYKNVTSWTHSTTAIPGIFKVCKSATLMPNGRMPVIALVSLPGSGNTWLRYLIERVTGIYTGSIYSDKGLIRGGFLGESCPPYSGRTVVVKMHSIGDTSKIQKTIFLVRNLYEALQAEFNRRTAHGHTNVANDRLFKTKDWKVCVERMLKTWQKLVVRVATAFGSKDKLLVVHYQDLKTDLSKELKRIVDFLDLRLDDERLQCTVHEAEGNFHRPKHKLSFDPFAGPLRTMVEKAIVQTQNQWEKHNLTQLRIS